MKNITSENLTIYFMSGTHWDREWYQTFNGFRFRLVNTLNNVIDVLEKNADFQTFTLDGQTIVLEDYLEIEPNKFQILKKLIQDGRIIIGPWYNMPDEFLLSGESLIRNLIFGYKICREKYEVEPWKYGYICDIFGHTAQMPQIFNGFGINYAVLGRGTNEHECPAHFRWSAPDESECITFKLNDDAGYAEFALYIVERQNADMSEQDKDMLIKNRIDYEIGRSEIPIVFMIDACDHRDIHLEILDYMDRAKRLYPNSQVKLVNLEEMGRSLENYKDKLPIVKGELNRPAKKGAAYNSLITNVLSSRYDIKKNNDLCQNLLEKWIEPFIYFTSISNNPIQQSYSEISYKYLLQNHPHDSICGCSIDQVHKDMDYRFDMVKQIAYEVITHGFKICKNNQKTDHPSDKMALQIFNPLPYRRQEVITVDLLFPIGFPNKFNELMGYEEKNCFKIIDTNGDEIPYNLENVIRGEFRHICGSESGNFDVHTISFKAELLSAGITEYLIIPWETPVRYFESLLTSATSAENEFIKIDINSDGTLNIYDKRTSKEYRNLLSYLDDGEIGDGWYHANPVNDIAISSSGSPCVISVKTNGPDKCTFAITMEMKVPKELNRFKNKNLNLHRSEETVILKIKSYITIKSNDPAVEITTEIGNNAKDHRLRMVLPTGVTSSEYFANEAFCFVERKCGIDKQTQVWKESEPYEKAMSGICGKRDKDRDGLAFVSAYGLHECAGYDDKNGSLMITMLRSFGTTVLVNIENDGQLQGDLSFKYTILPIIKATTYGNLQRRQDCLLTGIRTMENKVSDGHIAKSESLLELLGDSNINFSIMKRPESKEEKAVVVRLYNTSNKNVSGEIKFKFKILKAFLTNLNEEEIKETNFKNEALDIELSPYKINTYKVLFH